MIPVSFELNGNSYNGFLSPVAGSASVQWHLMVDNFYWGSLVLINGEFRFHSQTGILEDQADYFGSVVISWEE